MKTILITGASRGMGASTANLFAKNGYNVMINYYQSKQEADKLKQDILSQGCNAEICYADVSKEKDCENLIKKTIKKFGGIDILFNNAGIDHFGLNIDDDEKIYNLIMNTNFKSVFNCCRFTLPYMIEKKSGVIINNASIWGKSGASYESLYSASKGAIISFTKALSKEYGPSNIRVNAIAPGFIDTDMCKNLKQEDRERIISSLSLERAGTPDDVAKIVYFLASDNSSFITGQTIVIDGGDIDVWF